MKNLFLPVLAVLLIFSSCEDDTELVAPYLGAYQYIESKDTLDFVGMIELKEGNQVIEQGTVRNKGEANDLGYTYYRTGTYAIEDNKLRITIDFSTSKNNKDELFVDRGDLSVNEGFLEGAEYGFSDSYSKLNYLCPPNAFCVGPLPVYKKVNSN